MLIEAAKGGHTNVVTMLIDYPNSLNVMAAAPNDGIRFSEFHTFVLALKATMMYTGRRS